MKIRNAILNKIKNEKNIIKNNIKSYFNNNIKSNNKIVSFLSIDDYFGIDLPKIVASVLINRLTIINTVDDVKKIMTFVNQNDMAKTVISEKLINCPIYRKKKAIKRIYSYFNNNIESNDAIVNFLSMDNYFGIDLSKIAFSILINCLKTANVENAKKIINIIMGLIEDNPDKWELVKRPLFDSDKTISRFQSHYSFTEIVYNLYHKLLSVNKSKEFFEEIKNKDISDAILNKIKYKIDKKIAWLSFANAKKFEEVLDWKAFDKNHNSTFKPGLLNIFNENQRYIGVNAAIWSPDSKYLCYLGAARKEEIKFCRYQNVIFFYNINGELIPYCFEKNKDRTHPYYKNIGVFPNSWSPNSKHFVWFYYSEREESREVVKYLDSIKIYNMNTKKTKTIIAEHTSNKKFEEKLYWDIEGTKCYIPYQGNHKIIEYNINTDKTKTIKLESLEDSSIKKIIENVTKLKNLLKEKEYYISSDSKHIAINFRNRGFQSGKYDFDVYNIETTKKIRKFVACRINGFFSYDEKYKYDDGFVSINTNKKIEFKTLFKNSDCISSPCGKFFCHLKTKGSYLSINKYYSEDVSEARSKVKNITDFGKLILIHQLFNVTEGPKKKVYRVINDKSNIEFFLNTINELGPLVKISQSDTATNNTNNYVTIQLKELDIKNSYFFPYSLIKSTQDTIKSTACIELGLPSPLYNKIKKDKIKEKLEKFTELHIKEQKERYKEQLKKTVKLRMLEPYIMKKNPELQKSDLIIGLF